MFAMDMLVHRTIPATKRVLQEASGGTWLGVDTAWGESKKNTEAWFEQHPSYILTFYIFQLR